MGVHPLLTTFTSTMIIEADKIVQGAMQSTPIARLGMPASKAVAVPDTIVVRPPSTA